MKPWSGLEDLSDLLNPVAVKELRQIAEGRFVIFLLLGLVGLETLFVGGALLTAGSSGTVALGRTVFALLYTILSISCMLLVPVYIGWRLASERFGEEMDLIFITAISARHVVSGKLFSTIALTGLVFSTFLPFLGLTYYLRGVDLASIFTVTAFSFAAVLLITLAAMVLAALPVSRAVKIVLVVGSLLFLLQFGGFGLFWILAFLASGGMSVGTTAHIGWGGLLASLISSGSTAETWTFNLFLLIVLGILALLLFQVAVALLTPPAANRARGFRTSLLWCWAITGAGAAGATFYFREAFFVIFWCVLFVLIISAGFFVAVSERHRYGRRILRGVPSRGWPLWKTFLLSSGAAAGVIFNSLLGMATLLVAHFTSLYLASGDSVSKAIAIAAGLMLYSLGYSLIGLIIYRSLPSGLLHPKRSGLLALGVLLAAMLIPPVAGALAAPEFWSTSEGFRYFLLGNPVGLAVESNRGAHLVMGVFLSAVGLLGSASWMGAQFDAFRSRLPRKPAHE
ncbi:MAG TPA: hypothetical protein VLU25_22015 [Acidobacteriota bacterium]|nr:hypothetical protein [Acidobacteriota bacterium]